MSHQDFLVVASLSNHTAADMGIFLEMTCEEVWLSPGHSIELLAKDIDGVVPITICYVTDGLQIIPDRAWDVDWHIRFDGKIIKPGYPTRLSELYTLNS